MSDLVCVVAGGEWQAPIIEKLQKNTYDVLCLNLYEHTKGARLADYFEQVNVVDRQACLQVVKKYNIKAVLTDQSDISVATVAFIAEELGLKGIGLECAQLFTNKLLMRQKAKQLGINCPEFLVAYDVNSAQHSVEQIGLPIIVKPISSQASRGVMLINNLDEIENAIIEAFSFANNGEPILIEEYIDGQEWTVEGFKQKHRHVSLAISHKEHFAELPTVASSINYIPINDSDEHQSIIKQNDLLVEGMGLKFGITHAEYKYANGKFYLIEIAARGGGANISSHIIPLMSGVDVNQLLIDQIFNKAEKSIPLTVTDKFSVVYFLNFASGKVRSRTDESLILSLPFVIDFKYNFEIGSVIEPIYNDASRHAHVILSANSQAEQIANMMKIDSLVEVLYE